MRQDHEAIGIFVIGLGAVALGAIIGWCLAEMLCAAIDAWEWTL